MKTKKLDLLDFKLNELSREDISTIKAGEPIKPPAAASGNGVGQTQGDVTCWFNFENEVIYCVNNRSGEIVSGF